MNLRLEENYLVSTRACMYGRMLMHTCFQDLSLNPPGLCAHFLPLCTPKSAQSQAHFMCRLSHPSARYHTLPYPNGPCLPTPSYHKPSPSDPVSRAPTESVSTTSPAIPEPKVSDDETFPSYGPFFGISRLSLTLL